jgi:hypothetical protein
MSTAGRPLAPLVLAHALGVLTVAGIALTVLDGARHGDSLAQGLPFVVLLLVTLVVGWILAVRLPRHPVGWILMAVPALFTTSGGPLSAIDLALGHPAPAVTGWIAWYEGTDDDPAWSWLPPVWLLLVALPLRFPTGRLPSRRWRGFWWWAIADLVLTCFVFATSVPTIASGAVANPAWIPAMGAIAAWTPVVVALLAATFVVSIASLFVRYRGAAVRERAQLRWMTWSVALSVLGLLIGALAPDGLEWTQTWVLLLYALIPVSVAVAVLRYRLYEIDRIISRTAAYALVTVTVVGTYALVVLLFSLLVPGLQDAPIGVAAATLAAAAVFLPALRWVRRLIDRVFNRSQYDAERVVLAFGERIRNGADPHTAGEDLVGAVGRTLQPASVGLWIREPR